VWTGQRICDLSHLNLSADYAILNSTSILFLPISVAAGNRAIHSVLSSMPAIHSGGHFFMLPALCGLSKMDEANQSYTFNLKP
jgi:hypothetical protein